MEADLEESLREAFPPDAIEPVATGQRGADLLQKVRDARGAAVGGILWEIKNTKVFSDKWLGKLREDQRACGADIAVIVTKAMPDGIASFGQQDGVWIVSPSLAPALAGALRHGLLETARARVASDNQNEKQAALYAYLSGLEFKQRIESILEPLLALHAEQEKDRRAIEAGWARKEKALRQAITGLAQLYGGVSGVVGGVLPRIEQLELPAPEDKAA